MALSYSAYSQYNKCPYVYKRRYLDKMFKPMGGPAYFGTAIQKLFEFFINEGIDSKEVDPLVWIKENIPRAFKTCAAKGIDKSVNVQKYIDDEKTLLSAYNFYFILKGLDLLKKTSSEIKKSILLNDHIAVTGVMDFIKKTEDNKEIIVADAKGTQYSFFDENKTIETDQLLFYAMFCYKHFNVLPRTCFMLYNATLSNVQDHFTNLNFTQRIIWVDYTLDDISNLQKNIINVYNDIEKRKFDAKVNRYCNFCDFKLECPLNKEEL
ncbi:MAG: PD-(D/E)XK nuclease family protein [Candidatus Paceibacterota bacterium]|jgi:hypothetical protein